MSAHPLVALTFHAEQLHRDDVWTRVSGELARLERLGHAATLFVHPAWAIAAGVDLRDRLKELADRGHHLEQHTHYYELHRDDTGAITKRTVLATEVIRESLERDLDYLGRRGVRPRGYVSGGWVVHPEVRRWLAAHGFAYDCTVRTYRLRYPNEAATAGDDVRTPYEDGPVLQLPTTGDLRRALAHRIRLRPAWGVAAQRRYELVYLHDSELLSAGKRAAFRAYVAWVRRDSTITPVRTIADVARAALERR